MRVYTTKTINKGDKIYLCEKCYEKDCKQDNGEYLPTEKVDWKNHEQLRCALCLEMFYRFAFNK